MRKTNRKVKKKKRQDQTVKEKICKGSEGKGMGRE